MSERFTVVVDVECGPDGALLLTARPADPALALRVAPSHLTVTLWSDGDDAVRAAVHHRRSRTLAYLHANRALRELAERLRLELAPAAPVEVVP